MDSSAYTGREEPIHTLTHPPAHLCFVVLGSRARKEEKSKMRKRAEILETLIIVMQGSSEEVILNCLTAELRTLQCGV